MIAAEAMLFLTSCLLGAALGVVYDLFRAVRLLFPPGAALAFAEDGLFFAVVGVAEFVFFLNHTYGQLRGFLLIGQGLGFLIYYLTAGRAVYCLMRRLTQLIKGVIRWGCGKVVWIVNKIRRKRAEKTVQIAENPQNAPASAKST